MIRNYLITALRNIRRNFSATTINIAGLVLGMTGAINVYLLTSYLMSYDTYHTKADNIYRVVTESTVSSGVEYGAGVSIPLVQTFQSEFTPADEVAFISYKENGLITFENGEGDKSFEENSGIAFVSPALYKILDRQWLNGDPNTAFIDPNTVVLSARNAIKYFNSTDIIGKTLSLDRDLELKVTGVLEDFPDNTHFPFDVLISYETIRKDWEAADSWNSVSSENQIYLLLNPNVSSAQVDEKLKRIAEISNAHDDTGRKRTLYLQPLADLHFNQRFGNYRHTSVGWASIYTMIIIGAFLLITAIVNFVNLSTAIAITRAKEVGVRKVIGGIRAQLAFQFIGETFIITLISMIISLGLLELIIMMYINPFLNVQLLSNIASDVRLISFLITLLLLVTILAGVYPALKLSAFKPVDAIKSRINSTALGGFSFRKGLVVFQFFITQLFIIGTITMYWQMDFLDQFDMGFKKDGIVVMQLPDADPGKISALDALIRTNPNVESVSFSTSPPSSTSSSATSLRRSSNATDYNFQYIAIDTSFISLYGIQLVAGTNLQPTDTFRNILVNESLIRELGFENPQDAIGEAFQYNGRILQVQGVVADFQTASLKRKLPSLFLMYNSERFHTAGVRIADGRWDEAMSTLAIDWKQVHPEYSFNGQFLDQRVAAFYEGEKKVALLISIFAGVAIFIGCLGLYGLVLFMSKMKTKEIGIRKVMGASSLTIVNMFTKEFAKLVLLAFALSAPLAWFAMSKFLANYTHRIELGWKVFASGLAVTSAIAFATIAFRTIKSATMNPVNTLRSE
ncbi:MAG TPA: ABC transporter permease [Chryseosolibacter sp.]|nr:ABC transporter permease [Chryseosolibacter sp.]